MNYFHCLELEQQAEPVVDPNWDRFHHVLHKHGLHPGRTDDDLIEILDEALAQRQSALKQAEPVAWVGLTSEDMDELAPYGQYARNVALLVEDRLWERNAKQAEPVASEALRLADELEVVSSDPWAKYWERCLQAAAELRRQHAEIETLRDSCIAKADRIDKLGEMIERLKQAEPVAEPVAADCTPNHFCGYRWIHKPIGEICNRCGDAGSNNPSF